MKLIIKKGKTSKRIAVFIADSSSTTGAGLTGLVYNSASLVAYYWREDAGNAGGTAITLATATRGTWASGGFKEIDATNLPGWYEIGIPDAVLATGSGWAILHLKGAANMAPLPIEIQLVDYNPEDDNLGLTGLTGLTAPTAGALITAGSGTAQLSVTSGRAQADAAAIAASTGAASGLANFWNSIKSLTVDSSTFSPTTTAFETTNATNKDYYTGRIFAFYGAGSGALAGSLHVVTGYTYTGNSKVKLTFSPAVPDAPANGATLGFFAGSGTSSLTAAEVRAEMDSNSTQLAAIVGYVDTEIAAIKTVADHLATAIELDSGNYRFTTAALANAPTGGGGGLDAAGVRTAIGLTSANLDTQLATLSGYIDTEVAAIKAKTDNLPSSPAAVGSAMTLSSNAITTAAIQDGAITDAKFTVPTVSGVSTGVLSMIVQLWRRFFKKTTCTATELKTFANDGTTVLTQTVGESAGTQTVSEAT